MIIFGRIHFLTIFKMKSILKNRRNMFFYKACSYKMLHIITTLIQTAMCLLNVLCTEKWLNLGEFSSFILPIIVLGTLIKIFLFKYFVRCRMNYKEYHQYEATQCCSSSVPKLMKISKQNTYQIESNVEHIPEGNLNGFTIEDYIGAVIIQLISLMIFAFVCVALGAPLFEMQEQTILLSMILTLTSVVPLTFIFGWNNIFLVLFCTDTTSGFSAMESCAINLYRTDVIGSLLGSWCGTIVVPLDWNCEWQVYPIPNIIGGILGSLIASIYNTVFYDSHYVELKKKK